MWYRRLASAEIVIDGPYDGAGHLTTTEEYLDYLYFEAIDNQTKEKVGYILFQTPNNNVKKDRTSVKKKYLYNSFVLQVSVAPKYRRQGIATRLYERVDEYLQKHNKPVLAFFEYAHLSEGAKRIWDKRLLRTAQFGAGYGEHWIDDSGNLLYADGDVGSMGHEAHVIEIARSQIAGYEYSRDEFTDWDKFLEDVAQEILDAASTNPQFKQAIENRIGEPLDQISWQEMVDNDYVETELVKKRGVNKGLFDLAMDRSDARLYGMQVWGWKRVMNNYVETWQLTKSDCDIIASGLSDIAQEDEEGTSLWTIEVRSTNKYYPNIPLSVIESGPMAISKYARGQN